MVSPSFIYPVAGSEVLICIKGEDYLGYAKPDTPPFVVPACMELQWKPESILFAVNLKHVQSYIHEVNSDAVELNCNSEALSLLPTLESTFGPSFEEVNKNKDRVIDIKINIANYVTPSSTINKLQIQFFHYLEYAYYCYKKLTSNGHTPTQECCQSKQSITSTLLLGSTSFKVSC